MSCDHSLVETHLFDYLDSTTSPALSRAIEQAIDNCDHCQTLYQAAATTQQMQKNWQEQPVPDWHRTRFAVAKPKRMSWNWMNGLSLASSTFALVLVLFRVEFISNETGFSVSFGGKGSQAQVAELVDEKFDQLALQQINYIDNRFEEQRLLQVSDNQQMLATLLQHNRQERRQDLNTLMASWLQQRDMDQQKFNQRVDYIVENQIENNRYLNQVLKVSSQPGDKP